MRDMHVAKVFSSHSQALYEPTRADQDLLELKRDGCFLIDQTAVKALRIPPGGMHRINPRRSVLLEMQAHIAKLLEN